MEENQLLRNPSSVLRAPVLNDLPSLDIAATLMGTDLEVLSLLPAFFVATDDIVLEAKGTQYSDAVPVLVTCGTLTGTHST